MPVPWRATVFQLGVSGLYKQLLAGHSIPHDLSDRDYPRDWLAGLVIS